MGIVVGHHFARRLVVRNHPRRGWVDAESNRFAIDLDAVAKLHTLANVGGLVVDADAPFQDELLHLQTRANARLRQHFVQLGGLRLG